MVVSLVTIVVLGLVDVVLVSMVLSFVSVPLVTASVVTLEEV